MTTDVTDLLEAHLAHQLKFLQSHNPAITDGVIIVAMARIQGQLINLTPVEEKPTILNGIINIVKVNANIKDN